MYRFYNANEQGNFVSDCTVRAISAALNIPWGEAYKELSDEAREKGLMMDNVYFIEGYLDERFDRMCNYELTVGEFVQHHPMGTFLITMPSHITVAIDGTVYDTFDCSDKKMWCAWRVK